MNKNIISDQKEFFNKIAVRGEHKIVSNKFFFDYVNKEQINGFNWISADKKILEYGCGSGNSLDLFFETRDINNYDFYAVDIAEEAIKIPQKKYPTIKFFTITKNKIPQIKENSLDAAYMFHVLHHSSSHQEVFNEISLKLKPGGKFLINDLTSNNPIIKTGRLLFTNMPGFIKNRFSDDLVVEGKIPEKYKIDTNTVKKQLDQANFEIIETGYGHLFFFLFNWIDRFLPLTKINLSNTLYNRLIRLENWLLTKDFFKKYGEVVYIKCIKSNGNK